MYRSFLRCARSLVLPPARRSADTTDIKEMYLLIRPPRYPGFTVLRQFAHLVTSIPVYESSWVQFPGNTYVFGVVLFRLGKRENLRRQNPVKYRRAAGQLNPMRERIKGTNWEETA